MNKSAQLKAEIVELEKELRQHEASGGNTGCGCTFILAVLGGFIFLFSIWPLGILILAVAAVVFVSGGGRKSANKQAAKVRSLLSAKRLALWGEEVRNFVIWYMKQSRPTRLILAALAVVTIFCAYSFFSPVSSQNTEVTPSVVRPTNTQPPTKEPTQAAESALADETEEASLPPSYQIVYVIPNHRYDGGSSYYVLIDPVDLTSSAFKEDIKDIIRDIVSTENQTGISIEIHDARETLGLSYKRYGDFSLNRLLTEQETNQNAIHFIAGYDGNLSTGPFFNTLWFFPGAFTDNSRVGNYVETIEFDAAR